MCIKKNKSGGIHNIIYIINHADNNNSLKEQTIKHTIHKQYIKFRCKDYLISKYIEHHTSSTKIN